MESQGNEEEYSRCIRELAAGKEWDRQRLRALELRTGQDPATEAVAGLGADVAGMFRERLDFFRRTVSFCPECSLDVAGRRERARMGPVELWRFYLLLCQFLLSLARRTDALRILSGVAGPPGSGKSVFAVLLAKIINACVGPGEGIEVAICPLDGFHYPNAYLESHFVSDDEGRQRTLRSVKGSPETFDVAAFVETLDRLRAEPSMTLPRYDRRVHEPVPDAIAIERRHRIVLVEGNYLLVERPPWGAVAARLDVSLFLKLPLDDVKPWIVGRHVRGGRSPEDALRHFEQVDRKNYQSCMAAAHRADLIVERDAQQRIVALKRAGCL